jgi:hypothetical protein
MTEQDWKYKVRACNFTTDHWKASAEPPDLFSLMIVTIEKLKTFDPPIRPTVVYCNGHVARRICIDPAVRARLAAKRRRGPRLRDIVHSPARAKRRSALIDNLARSFGPGLTSPPRPWMRLAPPG